MQKKAKEGDKSSLLFYLFYRQLHTRKQISIMKVLDAQLHSE